MRRKWLIFASIALLPAPFPAAAQFYGPFDYTNPDDFRTKLPVVEQYHFNRAIETLSGTMPGGSIGSHLWYVVRSFPNHHRALNSIAKLWRESMANNMIPDGIEPDKTPDFMFQRAMEFAPHDGVVPLLYAIHLIELGGPNERAKELLDRANELGPEQAELQYNLGLMYLRVGEPEKAVQSAELAYSLGYPLPGLRNKLARAGLWPNGSPN
jgi:tetratricopeptide (TPR) repeat protein